jgi:hypothetical protein
MTRCFAPTLGFVRVPSKRLPKYMATATSTHDHVKPRGRASYGPVSFHSFSFGSHQTVTLAGTSDHQSS